MSVINQMLKDLDQRQADKTPAQQHIAMAYAKQNSNKKLVWIIIGLIIVNIAGLYLWRVNERNVQLEQQLAAKKATQNINQQQIVNNEKNSNAVVSSETLEQKKINQQNTERVTIVQSQAIKANSTVSNSNLQTKEITLPTQNIAAEKTTKTVDKNQVEHAPKLIEPKTENVSKQAQSKAIQKPIQDKKTKTDVVPAEQPRMSITRTKTSPEELVKQKMAKAMLAIENKNATLAEQLFEDVLLLIPEHIEARKQLAALWFGRQAYQDALNTLSQGISLRPNYLDFRVLQARIYLQLGSIEQAYETLNRYFSTQQGSVQNIEFLSLFAGIAQQQKHFQQSTIAYKLLTEKQPSQAKWWLGLAISEDSLANYDNAKKHYTEALTKINITENAKQFIEQRLRQLGE
jgi:MSHA biogenesis protein MshN